MDESKNIVQQHAELAERELFRKKNRLVYKPFFFMAVGFITIYTFLHWWLVIESGMLLIKKEIVHFLPMVLSCILVVIWLRPKIKLLKFPEWHSIKLQPKDLYYFTAWLVMAVPTHMMQYYIENATGKLTPLNNIYELPSAPVTKYYSLEEYDIDLVYYTKTEATEGRYGGRQDITLYIVAPIRWSKNAHGGTTPAWIARTYYKEIGSMMSNKGFEVEKVTARHSLIKDGLYKFRRDCRKPFQYLQREGNSDDGNIFRAIIRSSHAYTPGNDTVFTFVDEPFANRTGHLLRWTLIVMAVGLFGFLAMVHSVPLDEKKLHDVGQR